MSTIIVSVNNYSCQQLLSPSIITHVNNQCLRHCRQSISPLLLNPYCSFHCRKRGVRSHLSHLLHPLLLCLSNWLRESQHLSCCRGNGMRDGAWTARWWGTRFELMGILCLHLSPVTGFRTGFPQYPILFLILYKDTASPASVENTETCKKGEAGENRILNHARLQDSHTRLPKRIFYSYRTPWVVKVFVNSRQRIIPWANSVHSFTTKLSDIFNPILQSKCISPKQFYFFISGLSSEIICAFLISSFLHSRQSRPTYLAPVQWCSASIYPHQHCYRPHTTLPFLML